MCILFKMILMSCHFVRGLACDVVRAKVRALREINRKLIDPQSQMKVRLVSFLFVLFAYHGM